MILSNNKIYHNINIEQGPVTQSDHLPIICTITTEAITSIAPPRYKYSHANWEI